MACAYIAVFPSVHYSLNVQYEVDSIVFTSLKQYPTISLIFTWQCTGVVFDWEERADAKQQINADDFNYGHHH